jgi:thiamine biosynthesis lipoprotein
VFLTRKGMHMALGAIAKGYAADEAARILSEHKVEAAIVDLGGNILVYGKKSDGSVWRVGVQNPFSDRGEYLGILNIPNGTVVTSGVYERYFERDGKRYHHFWTPPQTARGGGSCIRFVYSSSSIDADDFPDPLRDWGGDGMALARPFPEWRSS